MYMCTKSSGFLEKIKVLKKWEEDRISKTPGTFFGNKVVMSNHAKFGRFLAI